MDNFFIINDEDKIGYKHLTKTDLGLKDSNNVTHIGLLGNVLTFLKDKNEVRSAMLIYNDYCDILSCSFDRIERNYGKYNSPKIKKGGRGVNNIVGKIREFAQEKPDNNWLLVWLGLDSEELVFWLIGDDSPESKHVHGLLPKSRGVLSSKTPNYSQIVDYITNKINVVSLSLQKDLETVSQIGGGEKPYKTKDIETANRRFKQIGYKGEELINDYLEKEKNSGSITSFTWENKSYESGKPFDFVIDKKKYIDVKATPFSFDYYMYFSNQEIEFITNTAKLSYAVFRVYDINTEVKKLKICEKCLSYMKEINNSIDSFNENIKTKQARIDTIRFGIIPSFCFSDISTQIIL